MDEFKLDKLIDFQCYISKENKKNWKTERLAWKINEFYRVFIYLTRKKKK